MARQYLEDIANTHTAWRSARRENTLLGEAENRHGHASQSVTQKRWWCKDRNGSCYLWIWRKMPKAAQVGQTLGCLYRYVWPIDRFLWFCIRKSWALCEKNWTAVKWSVSSPTANWSCTSSRWRIVKQVAWYLTTVGWDSQHPNRRPCFFIERSMLKWSNEPGSQSSIDGTEIGKKKKNSGGTERTTQITGDWLVMKPRG